jgi:hypothetical protein
MLIFTLEEGKERKGDEERKGDSALFGVFSSLPRPPGWRKEVRPLFFVSYAPMVAGRSLAPKVKRDHGLSPGPSVKKGDIVISSRRLPQNNLPCPRFPVDFAAARFEVRIVHPLATKQFRQPRDPDYKTDETDLAAMHLAAVNGFALLETGLDDTWRTLQLLIRHRRETYCSPLWRDLGPFF